MHISGQHESAHINNQAFSNARPPANFYKRTLTVVSYATACAIVVLAVAYWPAYAGSLLTKNKCTPGESDFRVGCFKSHPQSGSTLRRIIRGTVECGADAIGCDWWQ